MLSIALTDFAADVPAGVRRDRGRRKRQRDFVLLVVLAMLTVTASLSLVGFQGTGRGGGGERSLAPAAAPVSRPVGGAPAPAGLGARGAGSAPAGLGTRPAPSATAGRPAAASTANTFSTAWLAANPAPDLGLRAQSLVVVDLDSRQVLLARDMHTKRAPASLTKMLTAMVVADLASLDLEVTVPKAATEIEPDVMGLSEGEVVTVRTLLYGLFLDSGNDAAETLSRTLVSRERFLGLMNAKAARLGMSDSRFVNPSGLDEPGHRSTAYDLALAAGALAAHYPALLEIAGTREKPIAATAVHKAFDPFNLNKLLWTYPGATGLKTGYTDDAGGCVTATASRGDRRLVTVVLGADLFFTEASRALDYGFGTARRP